jgi:hypothetical protein
MSVPKIGTRFEPEAAVLKVNSPLVSAVHNKAALKTTAG